MAATHRSARLARTLSGEAVDLLRHFVWETEPVSLAQLLDWRAGPAAFAGGSRRIPDQVGRLFRELGELIGAGRPVRITADNRFEVRPDYREDCIEAIFAFWKGEHV